MLTHQDNRCYTAFFKLASAESAALRGAQRIYCKSHPRRRFVCSTWTAMTSKNSLYSSRNSIGYCCRGSPVGCAPEAGRPGDAAGQCMAAKLLHSGAADCRSAPLPDDEPRDEVSPCPGAGKLPFAGMNCTLLLCASLVQCEAAICSVLAPQSRWLASRCWGRLRIHARQTCS